MSVPPPNGYATVSPYLVTRRAEQVVAFVERVFGAKPLRDPQRHPDGRIAHAELRIGDSVVMVGAPRDGDDEQGAMLFVYVADVDATHAAALAEDAPEIEPPRDREDGDRRAAVRDPAGNAWYFATRLPA